MEEIATTAEWRYRIHVTKPTQVGHKALMMMMLMGIDDNYQQPIEFRK